MSCALKIEHSPDARISTILPSDTLIPILCDQCFIETDISLRQMVAGRQITCRCCAAVRTIMPAEVSVTHQLLKQYGFHIRS